MDDELKFIYFCHKCGLQFVVGREAEWTCDENCGAPLTPHKVEHWDCNGEFEHEEDYSEYIKRTEVTQ